MKPTDVLIVGSGMAGMVAALAAAARGKSVRIAARGAGALAISGGCVDVLGYVDGRPVTGNPLEAIPQLPETHPYRLIGAPGVAVALDFLADVCRRQGLELVNTSGANLWTPTILGTFRPSWLCPPHSDRSVLANADLIMIVHLPWIKDCHAGMVLKILRKQKSLKDKRFSLPELSSPLPPTHRNLTPLDMARYVDTPEGESWLLGQLRPHVSAARRAGDRVAVLLPPVLGVKHSTAVARRLSEALDCRLLEMAVPPPGVGGLRIRTALLGALAEAGVTLAENVRVVEARVEGRRCLSLFCDAPDKRREVEADSFIIATGGFLGGGNVASPGKAREAIFDLDLGAPLTVEAWSVPDVFDPQPYAGLGVRVNGRLNAVSRSGEVLWDNVFFAGRALAGYDMVLEKCGNGVAVASGYHAAEQC